MGWYHSHPGYGCWLSGIDVGTQMTNQQFQEPWVAIVVDPIRTISAGKVSLGAFRTYPKVCQVSVGCVRVRGQLSTGEPYFHGFVAEIDNLEFYFCVLIPCLSPPSAAGVHAP